MVSLSGDKVCNAASLLVRRSTKDALAKVWKEIEGGSEWIVDADLRDFFGSVDHEKLLTLVAHPLCQHD
jgi:retron-type reverse transcriptase